MTSRRIRSKRSVQTAKLLLPLVVTMLWVTACGDGGQAELDAANEAKASAESELVDVQAELELAQIDVQEAEEQLAQLQSDLDGYDERVERGGATYRERTSAAGIEPNLEPKSLDASEDAKRACKHFRNIVDDIVDGKLDAEAIGKKFSEVAGDADGADEEDLRTASAAAKDNAKAFDPETLFTAAIGVHNACSLVGR